jgi:hypothetical protein
MPNLMHNQNTKTLENSNTGYIRPFNSSIMIQRIQTIYLLLAAIALACPIFLPLATATGDQTTLHATGNNFFADGTYWSKENPAGLAIFALILGILGAIFLYQNRVLQMRLTGGMAFGTGILIALFAALGVINAKLLPETASVQIGVGGIPPVLAIVFLFLAYRSIKKDEQLVRSSDRLR